VSPPRRAGRASLLTRRHQRREYIRQGLIRVMAAHAASGPLQLSALRSGQGLERRSAFPPPSSAFACRKPRSARPRRAPAERLLARRTADISRSTHRRSRRCVTFR